MLTYVLADDFLNSTELSVWQCIGNEKFDANYALLYRGSDTRNLQKCLLNWIHQDLYLNKKSNLFSTLAR